MELSFSLQQILDKLEGARVCGRTEATVKGISTLKAAESGDLSFLGNKKYKTEVPSSRASVLLLPEDYKGEPQAGQVYIFVKNPSLALATLCREIEVMLWPKPEAGIHPSASVHSTAQVSPSATIGAQAVIEEGATIADHTVIGAGVHVGRHVRVAEQSFIMPKVVIMDYCQIGKRVRIQPGAVIGSDGFGYEFIDGEHHKVPQVGKVVVEDDVEIGANTTIDRARFGETLIGKGSKIDNLVQLAHNVVVGPHCIIVSQVGISGSTVLEDHVVIAGQAGLAGHLTVGRGTQIGAQSGLNHDLEPGSYVRGTPVFPYMLAHKIDILKKRLPDLFKRVATIEEMLEHLQHNPKGSDS